MSLIYLDNSASSFPKAPGVIDAVKDALLTSGSSGRASYDEAIKGSRILYKCREKIAQLFSLKESKQIILNSGATESLNTVIQGHLKPGMRVLTSSTEHNSVMRILHHLEFSRNIQLDQFYNKKNGHADLKHYSSQLKKSPDLVVLCHSSNVTGAVFPIKEMIEMAHNHNALVNIDGAQAAGHIDINLTELNPDFYCFSGHKGLLGPAGTGGFYIKKGLNITPLNFGGTGSRSNEEIQPQILPDKYESGTANIPGIAGLSAALSYIMKENIKKIEKKEFSLTSLLINEMKKIKGIKILGPGIDESRNSVVSFIHDTIDISDFTEALDEKRIASRMGLHCTPSAHKVLGTYESGGTIRLSPGYFNSEEQILKTIEVIRNIING